MRAPFPSLVPAGIQRTLTTAAVALLLSASLLALPAANASTRQLLDDLVSETGVPLSIDERKVLERAMPILEQRYLRSIDSRELLSEVFETLRENDAAKKDDETSTDDGATPDGEADPLLRIALSLNTALQSLDAHTAYLTPEAEREMEVRTTGEFGGLGLEVTMEDGFVKVVSPIDDTPAQRAGMLAGDLITQVDGEPVKGLTLRQAVSRMRGIVGSDIQLTVRRENVATDFLVTITRDLIRIRPVRHRAEGDVGYVRISSFNRRADQALAAAVRELEVEMGGSMRGLVLDLRNNPGGLLDQAIQVADSFLDNGDIVSVRGRQYLEEARYEAEFGDLVRGKQVVVLINSGSASASEIVAGALKDHRRAVLIGSRSFGKGSVQTILRMGRYGALRLTTQLYYLPNGETIQARGVPPDMRVEIARREDEQPQVRREENLSNALKGEPDEAVDGELSTPILSGERCLEIAPLESDDQVLACALAFIRLGGADRLAAAASAPLPQ